MKKIKSLIHNITTHYYLSKTSYTLEEKESIYHFYKDIMSHDTLRINQALSSSFSVKENHKYFLNGENPLLVALKHLNTVNELDSFIHLIDTQAQKTLINKAFINQVIKLTTNISDGYDAVGRPRKINDAIKNELFKYALKQWIEPNLSLIDKKEFDLNQIELNKYFDVAFHYDINTSLNLTNLTLLEHQLVNGHINHPKINYNFEFLTEKGQYLLEKQKLEDTIPVAKESHKKQKI
jgi:hypothetical protein